MLYKLAQQVNTHTHTHSLPHSLPFTSDLTRLCRSFQEKFTPVKYFSIDRVFRNETLDATHLAEFHQIEGVVADYGLTLGNLMGILHQFFTKLGTALLFLQIRSEKKIFLFFMCILVWLAIYNEGGFLNIPKICDHDFEIFYSRNHEIAFQASVQPLHWAKYGGLQLSWR